MRKRPMCLACLGFMLVLVLLRIAGSRWKKIALPLYFSIGRVLYSTTAAYL